MGKSKEVSDRISALRSKRGETQAQFAELVGVKQQAVSDWESTTGDVSPSCESYMRLGNVAPYPDCLWFWQEAGLDRDAMLLAAGKLLKESGQPSDSKMIAVPRLVGPRKTDPDSVPIFEDASFVPIPGAVGYYVVEAAAYDPEHHMKAGAPSHSKPLYSENAGYEPINHPGDIIVLDTSSNDSTDLLPFWDEEVLLQTMPEVMKIIAPPWPGLRIGRLCCVSAVSGTHVEYDPWYAHLRPYGSPVLVSPHKISSQELAGNQFGEWILARTADKGRLKGSFGSDGYDRELVYLRAKEELRLYKGNLILGRVLRIQPRSKTGK
jgi:transcriptional regulator with XRE-family HTH domain